MLRRALQPAEWFVLTVTLGFALFDFVYWPKSVASDSRAFTAFFTCGVLTCALGLFYRFIRRDEKLAATLIIVGLLVLFTNTASLANYLLLPLQHPLIDGQLAQIDAWLGFSWPEALGVLTHYPALNTVLRAVYMSSFMQVALIVLVLGFSGRVIRLHVFVLAMTIAALVAIGFWALYPSMGPATLYAIDPAIEAKLNLIHNAEYGNELRKLAQYGPDFLSPNQVRGLIAFPSFHTVMASLTVYAAWGVPWLRWPVLLINLFMMPAILTHGGHHLIDLPAGLVLAVSSIVTAQYFMKLFRH